MKSKFAILIVNWNSHVDVGNVLSRVPSHIPVVVVSNSSSDLPSLKEVIDASDSRIVIPSPVNGGYGAGMNIAIKYARANLKCESVLLLNPDIEVSSEFLEHVGMMSGKYDVLGFQQFSLDNSGARHYYPCAAFFHGGKLQLKALEPSGTAEVDIVTGAAILIKNSAFNGVGFFDESFFHYKEEFDLCYRMRLAGRTIAIDYEMPLHHRPGSSLSHESPNAIYYQLRNEILFLKKHQEIPRTRSLVSVLALVKYCFTLKTQTKFRTMSAAIIDGLLGSSGIRKV